MVRNTLKIQGENSNKDYLDVMFKVLKNIKSHDEKKNLFKLNLNLT